MIISLRHIFLIKFSPFQDRVLDPTVVPQTCSPETDSNLVNFVGEGSSVTSGRAGSPEGSRETLKLFYARVILRDSLRPV